MCIICQKNSSKIYSLVNFFVSIPLCLIIVGTLCINGEGKTISTRVRLAARAKQGPISIESKTFSARGAHSTFWATHNYYRVDLLTCIV